MHVPAAVWGVAIEFAGWICPLTPLENALRARAGLAGYPGGFVEHHLTAWLYPVGLTPPTQAVLGTLALLVNVAAYGLMWRRHATARWIIARFGTVGVHRDGFNERGHDDQGDRTGSTYRCS